MNDKEYSRVGKILSKLQRTWFSTLGLRRWRIKVTLYRERCEDNSTTVGECSASWQYQDVWLKFYLPNLSGLSEKQIEEVFVHECMHVLVNEMRMWGNKEMEVEKRNEAGYHEERVVTNLTQAILWAKYDGKQEERRRKK